MTFSSILGNYRVLCYELVIGSFDNQETMLKSAVGTGNTEDHLVDISLTYLTQNVYLKKT